MVDQDRRINVDIHMSYLKIYGCIFFEKEIKDRYLVGIL